MLLLKRKRTHVEIPAQGTPFPVFTDEQLKTLTGILPKTRPYQSGETICSYGDPGDGLYIVLSGAVRMYYAPPGVAPKELHTVGKGGFFGEVATLLGGPRTATVKATDITELLILKPEALDGFLKDHPSLVRRMMEGMAWRLRNSGVLMHDTPVRDLSLPTPAAPTSNDLKIHGIQKFLGTGWFLLLFGLLFALYIGLNSWKQFDSNWVAIALSLSVIQIIVGNLILNSQNRQTEAEQPLTEKEREANLHAAQDILGLRNETSDQYTEILRRLAALKSPNTQSNPLSPPPEDVVIHNQHS